MRNRMLEFHGWWTAGAISSQIRRSLWMGELHSGGAETGPGHRKYLAHVQAAYFTERDIAEKQRDSFYNPAAPGTMVTSPSPAASSR